MKEKNISWKWQENGNLTIWNTIPATRLHPVTGKEIWFNQINANHYTYYKCHPDVSIFQPRGNWCHIQFSFKCIFRVNEFQYLIMCFSLSTPLVNILLHMSTITTVRTVTAKNLKKVL